MIKRLSFFILLLTAASVVVKAQDAVDVVFATDAGEFVVTLDANRAPLTTANFLKYVDGKFYDGGQFTVATTRENQPPNSVKVYVIQGSMNQGRRSESFPAIPLENTQKTGIKHTEGTISLRRFGSPDSGTSEFFISLDANPEMDVGGKRRPDGQGFAAFGRVTKGMDVVRKIYNSPTTGTRLAPPIKMVSVSRKAAKK